MFTNNKLKIIYFVLCLFLFFEFIASEDCKQKTLSDEARLQKDLLCNYDKDTRPRENSKDAVNVSVRMVLKNFNFEDTSIGGFSKPVLTVGLWIVVTWLDDYLKWDPKEYGNHEELAIHSSQIWNPDFAVFNSVLDRDMGDHLGYQIPCSVVKTGKVTCIPHMVFEALCKPNYKKWPLDTQNCSMMFGAWTHPGEEVRFKLSKASELSKSGNDNPYWDIIDSGIYNNPGKYACCPNVTYPSFSIWMRLKRKATDGIIFLITPALVMVLLTITSLLLEINSVERVALMIINLYYHLIFLKSLSETAPVSGDTVPNAVAYFRDSTYLACIVLVEGILLRGTVKRVDVVPRWVSFMTSLINSGPGKIIMFHEFDPAATAIISGDPETLNKEEMELVSKREWFRFALLINRIFLIIIFLTYAGLIISLLMF